jgi:hypothetical protein
MPNNAPIVTGHGKIDSCIEDLGRSALRLAKEFRSVSQVAKSLILFDVQHQGEHCPATISKKGHSNLVRLMLVARDELVQLQKLRDEISCDPTAEIADKINIHKAIQKGLADLTKTSLDVEAAAEAAASKASDFLVKLAEFKQKDQHHRDKLKMDTKNLSDDEISALLKEVSIEAPADVDPTCMEASP